MLRIAFVLVLFAAPAFAHPAPTRTAVAKGVYLFRTEPYGDVGLDGNSVAIVGDDGVLVFDANGTPEAARAVLAQIRQVTDKPVRYLVYSHWHWDHWYGGEVYKEAFPNLVVVSHEATRKLMDGPAIAFNKPGLEQGLPAHIADVDSNFRKSGDAEAKAHLEADRAFLSAKQNFHPTLANLTYRDSLTIHLGGRTVRVLHHDRAITPGDSYLWLPDDGVVVTGDLLINPITFALFCYPSGWIASLKAIDALDAKILVPGHGAALQDETLLHRTLALLEREKALALAAKKAGKDVPAAKAGILADARVQELRGQITVGDASKNDAFGLYLVDWFVKRVYKEADGPLDDSIPNTF